MDGPPKRLLLIGMMGSGKTTTGRLLAERWGWDFLDSDAAVRAATGRTVPEIFAQDGEGAFRAAESAALRQAWARPGPVVVAVAGGAVLDPANRDLIADGGPVVWLRARPETLAVRVGSGEGRPLLDHGPAETLAELDAVRRPLYEELADVVVDVDDRSPADVADVIEDAVAKERT